MGWITFLKSLGASVPTPATDQVSLFVDDTSGEPSYKDDTGTITSLQGAVGPGVPVGGTTGQVLEKIDGVDFNTQWSTPSTGFVNPMTTAGDIIIGDTGGAAIRLPIGTNTYILTVVAGVPAWAAAPSGGTPAGSSTWVQYNNAGAFGAESAFAYDAATNTLTVDNITTAGLNLTAASTTSTAGLRLPHGTAPSAPTNGDVWTTTAGMYVRVNGVTVGPLSAGGGGGLTNWTEAFSSATQATSSFVATNGATNVNAALVAKGNAATVAQVPTGTTAGGSSRGIYATDWQKLRSGAAQVASGQYSTISGGYQNTVQGASATICGGYNNAQNQQYGVVCGGQSNSGGDNSFIGGGTSNDVVSSQYGVIAGGQSNQLTGAASWIPGGRQATDRGITNTGVWSAGQFSAKGDAQVQEFVLRSDTTNATPEAMTTDNTAASTANTVTLPNNSAYDVFGKIVARDSAGNAQTWTVDAMIVRGANAAATTLTGGGTPTVKFTNGTFTGTIALSANTTIGGLAVTVTGVAATNIKWVASLRATEVVG